MRGFTLIEIVVVIALFTIITSLGLIMGLDAFRNTLHRSEVATVVSLLEKARSRAVNNIDQATWGVCYLAPNYLILKDSAACDPAVATDKVEANKAVATASDFTHTFPVVVFSQLSGTTTPENFDVKEAARISTVSINHEGTIIW